MPKRLTQSQRVRDASQARRAAQKVQLRREILDAATRLFESEGYEALSMRQIAEQIGYTPTTIYRHFANKDALLMRIAQAGMHLMGARMHAAATSTDDPVERLQALGRAYVGFALAHPLHFRLMFLQRHDLLFEGGDEGEAPLIDSFVVLQDCVQVALDAGAIRPGSKEVYAQMLWATVHGLSTLALSGDDYFNESLVEATLDFTLETISIGMRGR